MIKEDTIYNYVNEVLRTNERARNDYFVLIMNVFVKMKYAKRTPRGIFFPILDKDFDFAPAMETITRHARQIQNTELRYQPNAETIIKRIKHQARMQNKYSIFTRPSPRSRIETMKNSWMSMDA